MSEEVERGLILAGGGMRVAWQAGVLQALDEAGLSFSHGDGTSGGIFNLGALLSGVTPAELSSRWRSLDVRRFVAMLPARSYLRAPTQWEAFGGAQGVRDVVMPHLGIDVTRIRAASQMTGSFNVADFNSKTCVAIPHEEASLDLLVAGVSLPLFLPIVRSGGRAWTDAVWIKDANLLEAVRRGCQEIWLVWCIGNTSTWGRGPLEQYVHMIEMSANGALFGELEQIAQLNARASDEAKDAGTVAPPQPVVVHVIKPEYALPLDPSLLIGRITTEELVAMGYRDAWRYLRGRDAAGVELDETATQMAGDLGGFRWGIRLRGPLTLPDGVVQPVTLAMVAEVRDLELLACQPGSPVAMIGGLDHPEWGYRPFVDASVVLVDKGGERRLIATATVNVDGQERRLEAWTSLGRAGQGRFLQRCNKARQWILRCDTTLPESTSALLHVSRIDALRALLRFEPTGVHTLAGRLSILAKAARLLRRVMLTTGDLTSSGVSRPAHPGSVDRCLEPHRDPGRHQDARNP